MRIDDLSLTLLFDNVPSDPRLQCLWGFSCLVETPGVRLLFDTGSNGRTLLRNMQALGIDPATIDLVFISHPHWDHIGGLDSLLELNPALELIVPASLSPRLVADLQTLCRRVTLVQGETQTFAPDLISTGELAGATAEQALMIATDRGPVVITGCAHPGIAAIARHAATLADEPVHLLAGGFHLFEGTREGIDEVAWELESLHVRHLLPSHCTGELGMARLRERFGARCVETGAGRVIRFDREGRPRAQ